MIYAFITYNPSFEISSPEDWYKRIEMYARVLEHLAVKNTIINIKRIDYEGDCIHNGIQYRFVNFGRKKTHFPLQLNRYVKNLAPDIVFVQGFHKPLQLIQLRLILNKKTKIIVQHHAEKPLTGIKKYIQRIAGQCADAYLFASKEMGLDWVAKGNLVSPEKIHEVMEVSSIFYPIDKSEAKLKTSITGNPVFLWVGRLNENKDPLNVAKAFLKYADTNPAARLYMIYHTDELLPDIKAILEHGNHKDAVKLIGQVPHDDLLYWFNSADFFISGSHYEGSGTAVCEAMSCGCIPIVTDIFSFRMITDNGSCGLLYKAGSEADLLGALQQLDKLNLDEMRKKALAYFKENLSFEAIAERIEEVAESL
jgi:glycosyltransferase involved in cell wall biosynthesis